MDEALIALSRKGLFKATIQARDIRSREHARKLFPLASPGDVRRMVTWVSPRFDSDGHLLTRSHFRLFPNQRTLDLKADFEALEEERQRVGGESRKHRLAKDLIAEELRRRIEAGQGLQWAFKDPDASDFPMVGNLLLGATDVAREYRLKTPFGSEFRLDIAILGPPIYKEPMVLGGVEIEFNHTFDGHKAVVVRSLGFPLMSIDIEDMAPEELTAEWAKTVLSATTRSDAKGQRRTYVYLHDLLYPLYVQFSEVVNRDKRHQYLIFSDDESLKTLMGWLDRLAGTLGYANNKVALALVNRKNEQTTKALEGSGAIVGPDWLEYNDHQCLRVALPWSGGPADQQAQRFYMTMARLILQFGRALVGYRYTNAVPNDDPEEDIWIKTRYDGETQTWTKYRVLPKRLSDPIEKLMSVVEDLRAEGVQDT